MGVRCVTVKKYQGRFGSAVAVLYPNCEKHTCVKIHRIIYKTLIFLYSNLRKKINKIKIYYSVLYNYLFDNIITFPKI